MAVEAVFFDLGETLVDESRWWADWADYLGIDHLTLMGTLGAVIARAEHHRRVFELLRPGLDVEAAYAERIADGYEDFRPSDLYADALPCLDRLAAAGYLCGVAGNADLAAEDDIRALTGLERVFTPASLGAAKPDPAFFERLAATVELPPEQIAYVGDRVDNDVAPALGAGMVAVWLRRGPWAAIQPPPEQAGIRPSAVIDSLGELPDALPD